MNMTRHASCSIWFIALAACATSISCGCAHLLGGAFEKQPEDMDEQLSPAAKKLVERVFADLGDAPVLDYHVHVVGLGTSSGACVNDSMLSWRHPLKRAKTRIYLSASGISDIHNADEQYVSRLVRLVRGFGHPAKVHILALDHYYNADGTINREKTEFYVPNDYVVRLATQYPDIFIPVVSVHPYRPDAVQEIEKWARQGVHDVKWLPNAQGIDPSDPRNDDFYRAMRKNNMVLLTHTGKEMAVNADKAQRWGNPLLLRRPLDLGVKVIMAHCASLGSNPDLDHPGRNATNVELFFRMMDDARYRGLLFADISATTQINRTPHPILDLIARPDLCNRLVDGSDYPLPAINCIISTRKLARLGMITSEERHCLNEIYNYNPLLFDFVLKRTIRDPATGKHLPASIFVEHSALGGILPTEPMRKNESSSSSPVACPVNSLPCGTSHGSMSSESQVPELHNQRQQNGGQDEPN